MKVSIIRNIIFFNFVWCRFFKLTHNLMIDEHLPKAKALLYAKTADARQTAAMILAKIQSPEAEATLLEALNDEKSDDTRDVMVEALGDKFYQKLSPTQIKDFVLAAQARGKLETPAAPWLEEATLPALQFSDDLGLDKRLLTRYLLYRLARAKAISPETEAKMLLPLLLKEGNADFAKKLFEAFVSQGADAKHKYCLILAGLLGDDRLVDSLRTQIVKWADSARGKMAEYGVGALALVGSNKALRIVEFFSRKYKTKNANIGTAAAQALEDAAEALGIEANELADSIIPDFGFENLYKIFQAGGEEIRAFIGKDFKIQYLNESGKVLKSPPKATDKAILDELKDIGKELREVLRLQSGRMELYLVIQRKWSLEKWQQFFLANPIMFVYATRLIWAAYDAQGQMQERFYVAEDTSLLNLEDEEVSLSPEAHIAMLHPLMIEESERKAWVSKCFEQGIEPLFPQMQRPVVLLEAQDLHKEAVVEFFGRRGEPMAVKGAFKRYGWVAWGIEDHGDISSFAKNFETMGIRAEIGTGGGLYLGWADTSQAEFYELHFIESSSRKVLKLQEVPPLVYSEVMGELRQMVPQA
jgi:hypothetical protein